MHRLKDQPAIIVLHVYDSFGAQDVLALVFHQRSQPARDLAPVDWAMKRQRDAFDPVIMLVIVMLFLMVMVAMFAMNMAQIAMRGIEEFRFKLGDAVQIESAASQYRI